jgi:hypothetical protein
MAVHFETKTPRKLLNALKKAVDDEHLTQWLIDSDGDFTMSSDTWTRRAWMCPDVIAAARLTFNILPPKESSISTYCYAVYHARLVEAATYQCDNLFNEARITAYPEDGDKVKSSS